METNLRAVNAQIQKEHHNWKIRQAGRKPHVTKEREILGSHDGSGLLRGLLKKKREKEKKYRRQWKPLPTLIKEKEPLWCWVP
jgi:hypothetical protein